MFWGCVVFVVFVVSFDGMFDFVGFLFKLFDLFYLGFIIVYLGVGVVFVGLIFGVSVIVMFLLLDCDIDVVSVGLVSFKFCIM